MTLAEFLLARIAEDEASARKVLYFAQQASLTLEDPKFLGRRLTGWWLWPDVEKTTTSLIAECEAKRRVVELYRQEAAVTVRIPASGPKTAQEARSGALGEACLYLAAVYSDHPDYRSEWKP